jgi:murein DD-endopeptidase MepM/ murein hydrolase activator NlpD
MHAFAAPRQRRAVLLLGPVALIAAGLAGCSADVSRFGDNSLSNPYAARGAASGEVTGSSYHAAAPPPAAPAVAHVDTQQLPPPPASPQGATYSAPPPARSDVTGSVHPTGASPSASNWSWEGGTAITVTQGDTISALSRRYGVPASAIMQANQITAPASIRPGQHLVIPRYAGAGPRPAAPATRVASNVTMVAAASRPAPPPSAAPAPKTPPGGHVVAAGESLSSIARRYHTPRKAIAKANNLAPDAKLKIGQHLVIPGRKAPATSGVAASPSAPAKPTATAPAQPRVAEASPVTKPTAAPPPSSAPSSAPKTPSKVASAGANAHVAAPAAEPGQDAEAGATPEGDSLHPTFRWPVRGRVIAGFGPKTNGQQNDGINLSVPEGTSVKAAEDGVVAYAGNELKGYGNLVLVRHSNGFVTAYAHASELMVKRGDPVKRGQVIMRSGQTGTVTSPQLHFEIRKGATPVDPTQYLSGT